MGTGVSQQGPGLEWALGHLGNCARKQPARGVPPPTSANRRPEVKAGGDVSAPSSEARSVRGLCHGGPGTPGGSVVSSPPPAPCPSPRGPLIGLPGSPLTRESEPSLHYCPPDPKQEQRTGPWGCRPLGLRFGEDTPLRPGSPPLMFPGALRPALGRAASHRPGRTPDSLGAPGKPLPGVGASQPGWPLALGKPDVWGQDHNGSLLLPGVGVGDSSRAQRDRGGGGARRRPGSLSGLSCCLHVAHPQVPSLTLPGRRGARAGERPALPDLIPTEESTCPGAKRWAFSTPCPELEAQRWGGARWGLEGHALTGYHPWDPPTFCFLKHAPLCTVP